MLLNCTFETPGHALLMLLENWQIFVPSETRYVQVDETRAQYPGGKNPFVAELGISLGDKANIPPKNV